SLAFVATVEFGRTRSPLPVSLDAFVHLSDLGLVTGPQRGLGIIDGRPQLGHRLRGLEPGAVEAGRQVPPRLQPEGETVVVGEEPGAVEVPAGDPSGLLRALGIDTLASQPVRHDLR